MRELYERVAGEVGRVVVGQDEVVRGIVTGLAVGGHVLLEGPPGVAKTLLASARPSASSSPCPSPPVSAVTSSSS